MDCKNLSPERKQRIVKKYYLSMFGNLEKIALEVSNKTGLSYKQLKSCESSRIWGSYSSTRVMKLNWKLIVLPYRLVYYVVCHELCHSVHMNHKPQFWKDVEKLCPDYKELKKELKKYSFVLRFKF
ncbi:MAG: M48 family metallopeptidase [Clostridia bacterium]|nr:M48 family metallopeptidase [Clostridia bacterium]